MSVVSQAQKWNYRNLQHLHTTLLSPVFCSPSDTSLHDNWTSILLSAFNHGGNFYVFNFCVKMIQKYSDITTNCGVFHGPFFLSPDLVWRVWYFYGCVKPVWEIGITKLCEVQVYQGLATTEWSLLLAFSPGYLKSPLVISGVSTGCL